MNFASLSLTRHPIHSETKTEDGGKIWCTFYFERLLQSWPKEFFLGVFAVPIATVCEYSRNHGHAALWLDVRPKAPHRVSSELLKLKASLPPSFLPASANMLFSVSLPFLSLSPILPFIDHMLALNARMHVVAAEALNSPSQRTFHARQAAAA